MLKTLMPVASLLVAAFFGCTPTCGQAPVLDQVNNSNKEGGTTNFIAANQVQQSFVPTLPYLDAVEVSILPGNPGPPTSVTLKILDGDQVLLTESQQVHPAFDGFLRFDVSAARLALKPGKLYLLRLEEPYVTFFWRYDQGDPYRAGEALFNRRPLNEGGADFRFKTYGHKEIPAK